MSDQVARATDTLVPAYVEVTLGIEEESRQTYKIRTFSLVKTIRVFALMTDLVSAAGIGPMTQAAADAVQAGELVPGQQVAPGFVARALAVLPHALRTGEPVLYRLLALLVTTNRQLEDWDNAEVDADVELLKIGKLIANRSSNDQIIRLVMASVDAIGVDTIVKNLPNLGMLLNGARS